MNTTGTERETRVLVPLDGSELAEQAIPAAAALAGPDGELVLATVVRPLEPPFEHEWFFRRYLPVTDQDLDKLQHAAHEALAEVAARWGRLVPRVTLRVTVGDAADGILRLAETEGAELIVMASHGRGALGRLRFGSVADRVARAAEIPVAVIRPEMETAQSNALWLTRVVVPFDGSELAAHAFPVAVMLARRLGCPVRVIRAIDPARTWRPAVGLGAPVSSDVVVETEAALRATAQASVDEAAARLGAEGVEADGAVVVGPAASALLDAVGPHDLVVLTSHGRSGLRRWWLGSVAEKLVRFAEAPVVMVPTPGRTGRQAHVAGDVGQPAPLTTASN